MKIAFAGLRHGHIFYLADMARKNQQVAIAGAWEEDPEAARTGREHFSEPFYESYAALLADPEVDIVAIGDYYGIRGQRIIQALKAGKHVITDKPVCTRLAELDEIEALVCEKQRKLGCMLDLRYDPALRLARDIIRGGALGRIRTLMFTGQHPLGWGTRPMWYFEDGKHGGTFNDIAIHGLDAVEFITGAPYARTLCARQWNAFARHAPGFRDCAQFMGELKNGAGLIADVSYSAPSPAAFTLPHYWRFTFWGDDGWLECRYGEGCVHMACTGDAVARTVSAPPINGDYLDELIREICGDDTLFNTETVLQTARRALELQKYADEIM